MAKYFCGNLVLKKEALKMAYICTKTKNICPRVQYGVTGEASPDILFIKKGCGLNKKEEIVEVIEEIKEPVVEVIEKKEDVMEEIAETIIEEIVEEAKVEVIEEKKEVAKTYNEPKKSNNNYKKKKKNTNK